MSLTSLTTRLHPRLEPRLQPYGSCAARRGANCSKRAKHTVPQAQGDDKPWSFPRFVQQVSFFNLPSLSDIFEAPARMLMPTDKASEIQVLLGSAGADSRPAVLVTGATGGLGRRVVALLLKQGKRVRALARDGAKAAEVLRGLPAGAGARLELVVADLSRPETLQSPELFTDVHACVSCAAANIRPKQAGSEAERQQRYDQGLKFYDPKIADDTPKAVDSRGVAALVRSLAPFLGSRHHIELLDAANVASTWGPLDDVVMGGRSESGLFSLPNGGQHGGPAAVFRGVVTEAGNGGFASVRSRNFSPALNLAGYDGLRLRVKGDGQRYKLTLRTSPNWDGVGYCLSVDTQASSVVIARDVTQAGKWQYVDVPFASLVPVFRARTSPMSEPFDPSHITSIQIMLSKFEYDGALNPKITLGAFELPIESISAYMTSAASPRLVHVSSAGVTRPTRPDLAPEARTKVVQMNDMLGGLLTCKLEGEDAVRESGVPFAIVRSCALTEEPAGAPLEIAQGDNIVGKMSRNDLAELCVHLLGSKAALDTTFEVKCNLPMSEAWQADPAAAPRDWESLLRNAGLQQGVTGKTVNNVYTEQQPELQAARQAATDDLMAGKPL